MKTIGISLLIGIAAAVGGIFFCDLFGAVFNGLGWETGRIIGMGVYLCVLLVVCTGVILSRLGKK